MNSQIRSTALQITPEIPRALRNPKQLNPKKQKDSGSNHRNSLAIFQIFRNSQMDSRTRTTPLQITPEVSLRTSRLRNPKSKKTGDPTTKLSCNLPTLQKFADELSNPLYSTPNHARNCPLALRNSQTPARSTDAPRIKRCSANSLQAGQR